MAEHDRKTIAVTVAFFTNAIAEEEGKVLPKHAWTQGDAYLQKNTLHGIKGTKSKFNSLLELTKAIDDVLIDGEIVLHTTGNMKKYFEQ
ncbi:MAG: hypothetical protein OXP71_18255 [Candidatus Poribacteria bacterium]|nr:hypothetical protein [Candidatus Poribacteria bacterium]